jgi:H+/gluconate symporter-like permease
MNPEIVSLLGIVIATVIFVIGIFRGYHIAAVSLVCVALIALFSGVGIIESLSNVWATKFAGVYKAYFLLFFFSALFAKSLGDTGAASAIAFKLARLARMWPKHEKLMAVLSIGVMYAIFTYGGISVFVVVFTVLYIAKDLFTELNIPWKLYTCGAIGSSTFTVAMLPGSPQLTNLIPMEYFGTDAKAAPVLGIVCSIITIILAVLWINYQVKKCEKTGEGFEPSGTALLRTWDSRNDVAKVDMPLWKCLLPSIVLFVVLNVFDASPVAALLSGTIASYILFNPVKQWQKIKPAIYTAVSNANQAIVALAAASGFGGMVASVSGFQLILAALDKVPGSPAFQVAVSVNVAAAFSASSSTGLRMTLDILANKFIATGIAPAALHRLSAISSIGLDTLPHSPALANSFYMSKLSYKDAYINNFMISVVITLVVTIIACILVTLGLTF